MNTARSRGLGNSGFWRGVAVAVTVLLTLQLLHFGYDDELNESWISRLAHGSLFLDDVTEGALAGNLTRRGHVSSKKLLARVALELEALKSQSEDRLEGLSGGVSQLAATLEHLESKELQDVKDSLSKQAVILQREMKAAQAAQAAELEAQRGASEGHLAAVRVMLEGQAGEIRRQEGLLRGHGAELARISEAVQGGGVAVQARQEAPLQHMRVGPGNPKAWKQATFTHHSTFGFIKYSTYRIGANKFATLALAALHLHDKRQLESCQWHGLDGSTQEGTLSILYMGEHHSLTYEIVIVNCELARATSLAGGHLIGSIDREDIVLMREDPNPPLEPPMPWKSKLTACVSPIYGRLSGRRMWEWAEYHRVVAGLDLIVLYDVDCVDDDIRAQMRDYLDSGMLDIIPYAQSTVYDVWFYGQGLAAMDCMYRSRMTSKWAMLTDLDEYLDPVPPNTVGSILAKYDSAPWLTHGTIWWGTWICNDLRVDNEFALERMVFHYPKIFCESKKFEDELCLSHWGHRKYFVNPRKTYLMEIHLVLIPEDGVDLHVTKELRHHHYSGMHLQSALSTPKYCNETWSDANVKEWWERDYSMATVVANKVKSCPFGNRNCVEHLQD